MIVLYSNIEKDKINTFALTGMERKEEREISVIIVEQPKPTQVIAAIARQHVRHGRGLLSPHRLRRAFERSGERRDRAICQWN